MMPPLALSLRLSCECIWLWVHPSIVLIFQSAYFDKNCRSLKAFLLEYCTFPRSRNCYINITWVLCLLFLVVACAHLQIVDYINVIFYSLSLSSWSSCGMELVFYSQAKHWRNIIEVVYWNSIHCMVQRELYRDQPIKTRQGIAEVPFADAWNVT